MLQQLGPAWIESETALSQDFLQHIARLEGCRGSNVGREMAF
jgi:hypothetical protein